MNVRTAVLLLLVYSCPMIAERPSKKQSAPKSSSSSARVVEKSVKQPLILLDTIESVILGPDGTKEIITKSDVEKPGIMGNVRPIDEIKFERLVSLDARKFKMYPNDDMVNKYLASIAKDNNLSVDDLNKVFTSAGFTRKEAEEQLKRIQAMNTMFDFKIRSNLIVPRKAVEDYYNAHPEREEASYFIEYAIIPTNQVSSKEQLKKQVMHYAATGKGLSPQWQVPFWINKQDIAPEKQFITSMQPGMISAPIATSNGYEIYRLKDLKPERLKPLEDRYHEIADILRRPKFNELLDAYRKSLFSPDYATIIDF